MFKAVYLIELPRILQVIPIIFYQVLQRMENSILFVPKDKIDLSIIEVIKEARKCVKSISAELTAEYFTVDEQGKSWKH